MSTEIIIDTFIFVSQINYINKEFENLSLSIEFNFHLNQIA